jgi:outer membrane lipoprotein SlyB
MNKNSPIALTLIAGALALAGCAQQPSYQSQGYPSQGYPQHSHASRGANLGTVEQIEVINRGDSSNLAGTVIGGVVGGLIGHQIGSGTGRTVATIAGATGGAYLGNRIENRRRGPNETFRVSVRMHDGSTQTVVTDNVSDLQTGDRVRVEGNAITRL